MLVVGTGSCLLWRRPISLPSAITAPPSPSTHPHAAVSRIVRRAQTRRGGLLRRSHSTVTVLRAKPPSVTRVAHPPPAVHHVDMRARPTSRADPLPPASCFCRSAISTPAALMAVIPGWGPTGSTLLAIQKPSCWPPLDLVAPAPCSVPLESAPTDHTTHFHLTPIGYIRTIKPILGRAYGQQGQTPDNQKFNVLIRLAPLASQESPPGYGGGGVLGCLESGS